MRRINLIGILVVALFLFPMLSLSSNYNPATTVNNPALPQIDDSGGGYTLSGDHSTGVAPALPVTLSGQVSNVGQGTMSFDSSSSGVASVALTDGWTGTDLQAQIDTLAWTAKDALQNGDLNGYHSEQYIVTSNTAYNQENVPTPNGWTIIKDVVGDNPHPQHGMYEIDSDPNGRSSTWGIYLKAELPSAYTPNSNDEMYISQMVSMPYRELYSAQITFDYNVRTGYSMDNKVFLFVRLAGYNYEYHVFKSGDPTGTWLTTQTLDIPASAMSDLSSKVMSFDIGIATDENIQLTAASNNFAYIDNVKLNLIVRPFPEQIDLKANGTLVWGSTMDSIYPYVPDDANRDCYDDTNNGIILDGYSHNGVLDTGIYSSSWLDGLFETGLQFPLNIPHGAIITSAYLEIEPASGSSPYLYGMRVHVADEDNVTAFTSGGHLENLFNWLSTSIDWSFNSWITSPATRYRSPEIGPLIQNVVSRPGWSEGNYICIMTSHMYSDYYQRWSGIKGTYGSFFSPDEAARLFVEYVIPEPEDHVLFFNYQKDITINHLNVAGDLNDFPVLIDITDNDLKNNVLSEGNDIAFTIDGVSVDHEVELFEPSTGHLVAWVKVPYLSSTVDTVITMHYGCKNAPPVFGSRVWSDYETVQHLNQDPTGVNYDSTSSNHDGTSYGGLGTSDLVTGKIGNAIDFDGSDDVISIGQIDTDEWTQFTMSAWFNRTLDKDARVFSKSTTTTSTGHIMTLRLDPTNHVTTRLWADPQAAGVSYSSTATASNFTWHYVSWSWDPSRTGHEVLAYLDGALIIDRSYTGTSIYDSDAMFVIGNNDLLNSRYWAGAIDEVRLTTLVRSAAWIGTEFNNQNDTSSFYTVGSERTTPNTWIDASETRVIFTTASPDTVSMNVNLVMDVSGFGQTLDENYNDGVTYYIESGATIVNWTAKVLVSPPAGATSFGFDVKYPRAEWKPTQVINPLGQVKTDPLSWWYQAGTLTLNYSAIDFWGVWTLKFISWNYLQDIQLSSPSFNVLDDAQFTVTTPTVLGANVGLDLVDPNGVIWDSQSYTTSIDPAHRFPSFRYSKNITISNSLVYGDVTDFPVLLQFTDNDLHSPSKVRSDGSDIMFAMGDTILDHEIENFNQTYGSTARITAWVKANLSSSSTNTITMYYGSPVVNHLENPAGVWSSDFEAVWHLGEYGLVNEASGAIHYDSSGNGYNGVQHGNVQYPYGKAGYGQNFDGVNDYIAFDQYLTPNGDLFITGWFQPTTSHDQNSPNTRVILSKYIDIDHDLVIALAGQDYGRPLMNGSLVFKIESSPDSPMYTYTSTLKSWTANQWYFFACYADEDTPINNKIWIGSTTPAFQGWATVGHDGSTTQANASYVADWQLGGGNYESTSESTGWFAGNLDEFRIGTSLRSDGWIQTEYRNQVIPQTFALPGSEQPSTPQNHVFTKTIDSTTAVGNWTAIAHYNDTGSTVTSKTGLFERTFIVKHGSALTLNRPTDAVGDHLSVKTAGDVLYVEYELRDSDAAGNPGIEDATVTMNWTAPSTITFDDYGAGVYRAVVDTSDLGDNKQWRIDIQSSHPYYTDANEYFNLDLYHETILTASGELSTPADFIFNTTLTLRDDYTGAPLPGATIVQSGGLAVPFSYVDNSDGTYKLSIPTSSLSLGLKQFKFNASISGVYLQIAQTDVAFTVRQHYTAASVTGDMTTPYGDDTSVTVSILDLDTGRPVDIIDIDLLTFTYSPAYGADTSGSYTATLTSADWNVGSVDVTLDVTMSSSRIATPAQYHFTVQITTHGTSVTVTGVTTIPYSNQTSLTIVLTDLVDGSSVPIGSVSNIQLQYSQAPTFTNFGSYDIALDTSSWPVGTHIVTVVVTMSDTIYSVPSNYQFSIKIRSMTSVIYHEPSPLNFPNGTNFEVYLRLNVSEPGSYFGSPITGRNAGEFSVPGYSITIDTTDQAIGRYKLTIDESYFRSGGLFQIKVYFTSTDNRYANTYFMIQFRYRDVQSTLTSPNYPQVTTPFGLDVKITLNYTDLDFGSGIVGAGISASPNWIANWSEIGGGIYEVWIDVSTLVKGLNYLNLTATKSGVATKSLEFKILIREAYTSAIPTVSSLVIPIGNSPYFYVDFTDVDRSIPIDNSSSPYTQVVSTWHNFSVEYIPLEHRYKITFHTSSSDTISSNIPYNFEFSKGTNYQPVNFNIIVTIRTHNTEFRIVSSIEATSTTGTFNISVYYGDLDSAIGIRSALVVFLVSNLSGPVISSYDYNSASGDGYYTISVAASQFGLGPQTFTVYADWTGAVLKYQDKSFVTSATVIGRDSTLALLIGSEPTPYNEDMSYTFFYSDSGTGIGNLSGNVFFYVSFQGQVVNPSDVIITDFSLTDPGKYSVDFNSGIFSRTGLIYMNVFVNWSKGVAPYYSNRTDTVSIRVLLRDTLLSITPPSSTSYNENATFTLNFDDIGSDTPITGLTKQEISLNISFSLSEDAGTYEISFNTGQFGSLGLKAIQVNVTWVGAPFYASRTGRITYITVIARTTSMEYLTPPPTQYGDQVIFNVTWTDTTAGSSTPITGAILVLKEGLTPIDTGEYAYVEIASGVYQVTLNTTYAIAPGTDTLRVELSSGAFYYASKAINRQFTIQERRTIVAAEPVANVPFGSTVTIIVSYLDLFNGASIANGSANGYPVTISIAGQSYTSTWRVSQQNYQVNISWNPSWDATWAPGTIHSLIISMDYNYQAPYYSQNQATITFAIRNRQSSLALVSEPETTPFLDDVNFTLFYSDNDAAGAGIASASILITGFTETTDFLVTEGAAGNYTITVFTTSLGSLGTHVLNIQAVWTGLPYHANAGRSVSVLVRTRATKLEVTVPPSQTLYLDNVIFEYQFNDLDAGAAIPSLNPSYIHLYWPNGSAISQSDYNIVESSGTYELTISSTILSTKPVSGLSIRVVVDWPAASTPFYADDFTIVKTTIVGRSILVETDQIERTPKEDLLNITIHLSDLDNSNPIDGAIIQFSCKDNPSISYTSIIGTGNYTYRVDTQSLLGTGTFFFYITVQWNPNLSPFYANRSTITLSGIVDLVRTSLQVTDVPPSVQFTGNVSFLINWTDIDHGLQVSGFAGVLQSNIKYSFNGLAPAGLTVSETVSPGVYNISFSTSDLPTLRAYTLVITATGGKYASATANPQFSLVAIDTEIELPFGSQFEYNWTDPAEIYVDYRNNLDDILITGASVSWYNGLEFGGYLSETGIPGRYRADIDTGVLGFSGGTSITIKAELDKYTTQTTYVYLNVLPLPSDIVFIEPSAGVIDVNRGSPFVVSVILNDTIHGTMINNLEVETIYVTFQGQQHSLTWNALSSTWDVTVPGPATVLMPGSYDVRITAGFYDYQASGNSFRIRITEQETKLVVLDPETLEPMNSIDAVYSEVIHIGLSFTNSTGNLTSIIDDAFVYWYSQDFKSNMTFAYNSTLELWVLEFNTSLGLYGTWGLTFTGIPTDPILARSNVAITLTIARRPTEVLAPAVRTEVVWGWTGNISFTYYDTASETPRGVIGANVTYDYGDFVDLPAFSLGNGTYLVFINTTYLTSDAQHRIIVDFAKPNFEERTSGTNIRIDLRPTELLVSNEDPRTYATSGTQSQLEIPMNDLLNITFFYNDTSSVGGLLGGLEGATIDASLVASVYFRGTKNVSLLIEPLGNGWYSFIFDTNNLTYYDLNDFVKDIKDGSFTLTVRMESLNRKSQEVVVGITIIEVPTEVQYSGETYFNLEHTDRITIQFTLFDTWHQRNVEGATLLYSGGNSARVLVGSNRTLADGLYEVTIQVGGTAGDNIITLRLVSDFYQEVQLQITVTANPNDTDILIGRLTTYGLPISIFIIALLGAYVKVWSVPKRIRQINGQLKTLRKGKMPKPIGDVKSRQQLAAELFNDTFESLKITRTAAQMPEDAIPIEVPEMGELLMQLAILTNLSQSELDDFQGDIKKMKMSEQAAFVKEVIMQEAIRAARRQGRTIEETLASVQQEALRRLGGEEEAKIEEVKEPESEEPVFLEEEEEKVAPEKKVTPKEEKVEEEPEAPTEKMSLYEIEELRKDLERRGVPPHEIETIIEQAKELPRDLVDELVKSLEGTKD